MTVAAVLRSKGNSVISVGPDTLMSEVVKVIASRRIGAVVVLDNDSRLVGIVSERDVVKALDTMGAEVLGKRASDLMTRHVVTGTLRTTIDQAMEIMDVG